MGHKARPRFTFLSPRTFTATEGTEYVRVLESVYFSSDQVTVSFCFLFFLDV